MKPFETPKCLYCGAAMNYRATRYMDSRIVYFSCPKCMAETPHVTVPREMEQPNAFEEALAALKPIPPKWKYVDPHNDDLIYRGDAKIIIGCNSASEMLKLIDELPGFKKERTAKELILLMIHDAKFRSVDEPARISVDCNADPANIDNIVKNIFAIYERPKKERNTYAKDFNAKFPNRAGAITPVFICRKFLYEGKRSPGFILTERCYL